VPGYVAFVDTLPTTATQKLQRGEIKRIAQTLVSDACTIDLRDFKGDLRRLESAAKSA